MIELTSERSELDRRNRLRKLEGDDWLRIDASAMSVGGTRGRCTHWRPLRSWQVAGPSDSLASLKPCTRKISNQPYGHKLSGDLLATPTLVHPAHRHDIGIGAAVHAPLRLGPTGGIFNQFCRR
jgi:hypothetical protein